MRDKVIKNVLEALGTPRRLIRATATNVFENRWRVNLWCARPGSTGLVPNAYIPYSFFVHIGPEGQILKSQPPIERTFDLPFPEPVRKKPRARRKALAAVS